MTLYDYSELNEVEQQDVLWDHGVMVDARNDGDHNIILYQMFSFYVELYYNSDYNLLKKLRSFSRMECLDVYLQQVDLSEIGYPSKR